MQPIVTDRVVWSVGLSVTLVSHAKLAEPTEMPIWLWTRVGPTKHAFGGLHTGATWRIPVNHLYAAAMRPFCQITWTTCFNCN